MKSYKCTLTLVVESENIDEAIEQVINKLNDNSDMELDVNIEEL